MAVDESHTVFVIDNAVSGFSLHRFDTGTCLRTFDTKPTKAYPKQVAFAAGAEEIIGGSENGLVYMFNKESGKSLGNLRHAKSGRTQTLTVSAIVL